MYNDLVKDLLRKHFGEPRSSLTIGDAGELTVRCTFTF